MNCDYLFHPKSAIIYLVFKFSHMVYQKCIIWTDKDKIMK
jgi:hypothetical protein